MLLHQSLEIESERAVAFEETEDAEHGIDYGPVSISVRCCFSCVIVMRYHEG
jgi:hypothetical protein